MATEGNFPKADGDIFYASEANRFNEAIWNNLIYIDTIINTYGILAHSATAWTAYNGTTTVTSSDSGVTWSNATTDDVGMTGLGRVCSASKTSAIICDHNSNSTFLSTDSGANWTAANTDPTTTNRVLALSYPTTTVAVCGVDTTSTDGIFYADPSSGAGSMDWTAATTGPAVDVPMLDMFDGSNGLAVDNAGNIWSTSDGGVNWTDSGQNLVSTAPTVGSMSSMVALSATTFVCISESTNQTIQTADTTSGGVERLRIEDITDSGFAISNLIKTTRGYLYFVTYYYANTNTLPAGFNLFRSTDSGVTWESRSLGSPLFDASTTNLSTINSKTQLLEYDTNKIMILSGNKSLILIDESY